MRIEVGTTSLWAELARWRGSAHEVIARPEHWAIHGTTRMGKVLTETEALPETEIDAASVAAAVACARGVMDLLERGEGAAARWKEPAPGEMTAPGAARAAARAASEVVEPVDAAGIEVLTALAHALQAGAVLPQDASGTDVLALAGTEPRVAERASGPWSALLALSADTLYVPVPLRSTWDSPAFVLASSVGLRADLAALPAVLHGAAAGAPPELAAAATVVRALSAALERAGAARCVRVSG